MYRENYSDQPPNIPQINPPLPNYEYRPPNFTYKPPGNLDTMMPSIHQSHPMYYENQQTLPPPIEQNPYMGMMSVQGMEAGFEHPRYFWREMEPKHNETYGMAPQQAHYISPPISVVQRISGIIKSQYPMLQAIMSRVSSSRYNSVQIAEPKRQQARSRSRSRSKERHRKGSDPSHDWLCRRCSFSNYDWRENCKKCNETRPPRSYVPGPEDWKCPKCSNINYARRAECNRCKLPKIGRE